jgi:hypothetical protein
MKTISQRPQKNELNRATGMVLTTLGLVMLVLCYLADGNVRALPAQLGGVFLIAGVFIFLLTRHRPRGRTKVR